jgi:hypothetical protein
MKPLTHTQLKRGQKEGFGDWISAAEQATDAGRNDFAERQRQRRLQAQAKMQTHVVIEIKRKS